RKNNAVISFNDDEEDEPPLHIGDVIGLTELQQYFPNLLKNENQNGIITTVGKCGKKSSLDAILHRQLSRANEPNKILPTNREDFCIVGATISRPRAADCRPYILGKWIFEY
ncbi:MAG: hypothetical protein IJA21_04415, partial [Clostridia bacterium]|nr:hypothetical protein [Clostridia bacterium]